VQKRSEQLQAERCQSGWVQERNT